MAPRAMTRAIAYSMRTPWPRRSARARRGWRNTPTNSPNDAGSAVRGRVAYVRYCLDGRPIEEATEAAKPTEARTLLNERLGGVSKGKTPAAVSKVRIRELYDYVDADYENKRQDRETLAGRWKHL